MRYEPQVAAIVTRYLSMVYCPLGAIALTAVDEVRRRLPWVDHCHTVRLPRDSSASRAAALGADLSNSPFRRNISVDLNQGSPIG